MTKKRRRTKKTTTNLAKRQNLGKGGKRVKVYTVKDVFTGMQRAIEAHRLLATKTLKEQIVVFEETGSLSAIRMPSYYPKRFTTADGESWKLSLRMRNFLYHGVTCSQCKIEGQYFIAEKFSANEERPHLNLYARDTVHDEVLMTHDHIVPRSAGGSDTIKNVTTMCTMCNTFKSKMVPSFVTSHNLTHA